MTTPARLQLSRRKGFNLQAASVALNGLEAVKVARPSPFGNPFIVNQAAEAGQRNLHKAVVDAFRDWLAGNLWACGADHYLSKRAKILSGIQTLRGKNLACWCKLGALCHADVLLELANRPICEEVK
jgi:hypothetical protein